MRADGGDARDAVPAESAAGSAAAETVRHVDGSRGRGGDEGAETEQAVVVVVARESNGSGREREVANAGVGDNDVRARDEGWHAHPPRRIDRRVLAEETHGRIRVGIRIVAIGIRIVRTSRVDVDPTFGEDAR